MDTGNLRETFGFFKGDGCFSISLRSHTYKHGNYKCLPSIQPSIFLSQDHKESLIAIKERLEEYNIHSNLNKFMNKKYKTVMYNLCITRPSILVFCRMTKEWNDITYWKYQELYNNFVDIMEEMFTIKDRKKEIDRSRLLYIKCLKFLELKSTLRPNKGASRKNPIITLEYIDKCLDTYR